MKNLVLDDLFYDEIRNSLLTNEKVIWEGKPQFRFGQIDPFRGSDTISDKIMSLIGLLIVVGLLPLTFFLWMFGGGFQIIIIMVTLGILAPIIQRHIIRKKTTYIMTNQRIIFKLWDFQNGGMLYDIPFKKINDIVITEESENNGVIFLAVHDPQSIFFDTTNLKSGDRRHQPTIELIDNVHEVGKYIQLGIIEQL